MSTDDSILLLSIVGGSSLASRLVFQLFSHSAKLDATSNSICTAGLAVILTALFPEFFLHRAGEIGYALIFGFHAGFWSIFVGAVADELVTGELLAFGRGYITLSVGFGLAGGLPVCAWLRDRGVDFEVIFYAAGNRFALCAVGNEACHFSAKKLETRTNRGIRKRSQKSWGESSKYVVRLFWRKFLLSCFAIGYAITFVSFIPMLKIFLGISPPPQKSWGICSVGKVLTLI